MSTKPNKFISILTDAVLFGGLYFLGRFLKLSRIFFILAPSLLILLVPQGREFLIGIFDDTGWLTLMRLYAIIIGLTIESFTIWMTLEKWWKILYLNNNTENGEIDKNYIGSLKRQNGYEHQLRIKLIMALIPFWMLGAALFVLNQNSIHVVKPLYIVLGLFFMALIIPLNVLLLFNERKRNTLRYSLAIVVAILIIITSLFPSEGILGVLKYILLIASVFIIPLFLVGIFKHLVNNQNNTLLIKSIWVALLVFHTGFLVYFLVVRNYEIISPIFALISWSSIYIFVINIFLQCLKIDGDVPKEQKRSVILRTTLCQSTIVLYVLFALIYFNRKIHYIKPEKSNYNNFEKRLALENYFDGWWKAHLMDTIQSKEIPIFLVASQGGGSRAGMWASMVLNEMEVQSNYTFHSRCFAITSSSGGSSGIGATLATWRLSYDQPAIFQNPVEKKNIYENFGSHMYQRNYLTGSFMSLFGGEVLNKFILGKGNQERSYRLIQEEALGWANSVNRGRVGQKAGEKRKFSDYWHMAGKNGTRKKLFIEDLSFPNYYYQSYLSFWYDSTGKATYRLPLFFPITKNIQTGRPGFPSPLRFSDSIFIAGIDLVKEVEDIDTTESQESLSYGTAISLSQAFPIVNSQLFIPGTGSYFDGGYFENMGLNLMTPLYEKLRNHVDDTLHSAKYKGKNIKFYLILIYNESYYQNGNLPLFDKPGSEVGNLLKVASGSVISGNHHYFLKQLKSQVIQHKDSLIEITLQNSSENQVDKLPLGRWLSIRSAKMAYEKLNKEYSDIINSLMKPLTPEQFVISNRGQ